MRISRHDICAVKGRSMLNIISGFDQDSCSAKQVARSSSPLLLAIQITFDPCQKLHQSDGMYFYRLLVTLSFVLAAFLAPTIAFAQSLAADPQGSGVIIGAARWLQGTLLGTVATVVAVIAVAVVGLLMLSGRINWRYGAIVILGCFILFGAASVVGGIRATAALSANG
jgi:type IV secretory pathway VirB2 component (pilin)